MNTIKYRHANTGEIKTIKVTQNINAIMGYGFKRGFAPFVACKARADKIMLSKGFVRASKGSAA